MTTLLVWPATWLQMCFFTLGKATGEEESRLQSSQDKILYRALGAHLMTENWGILSSCTRLFSWVASMEKLLLYSPSFSSRRNLGVEYNRCLKEIGCCWKEIRFLREIRCCWKEIRNLLERNQTAVNWKYGNLLGNLLSTSPGRCRRWPCAPAPAGSARTHPRPAREGSASDMDI